MQPQKNPIPMWKRGELRTIDYLNTKGFKATETLDLQKQYQDIDIDAFDPRSGRPLTFSVKTQVIANKTGNFSFEEYAIARDGTRKDGNFRYSKALIQVIALPHQDTDTLDLYIFNSKKLKEWIYSKPRIRKTLSNKGFGSNTSSHFVDYENIIIPIKELVDQAMIVKTINL